MFSFYRNLPISTKLFLSNLAFALPMAVLIFFMNISFTYGGFKIEVQLPVVMHYSASSYQKTPQMGF